jgi:hypothetical protein
VTSWLFKHNVVEACTAVKGPTLLSLLDDEADKVFYLDPDVAVLGTLTSLVEALDDHSIILTPHQVTHEQSTLAILDNEVASLQHGTYNLGFLGVRNDATGRSFAQWWRDRLVSYCYDDICGGLFVDQRWCDLVPAYFDRVGIIRDAGCNVASWNLSQRRLSISASGEVSVNGVPLRFFHFTKLGPLGDAMTERYARDNTEVYELWAWYRREVELCSTGIPATWWRYGQFDDGQPIEASARKLYRDRPDLQSTFQDPFAAGPGSYRAWLNADANAT